ncbi:MAG: SMC-Scp complex subunit ScpB [Candidatus Schekmanbacteria bacterium]|nr:SMC-Scp complex subunit ScpB [Candidatus Schekmanbacteria bacterium]
MSRAQIVKAFADAKSPCRPLSAEEIAAAVIHLTRRCTQTTSALALLQTRSGLQLRTDPRLEPWLRHFHRKIRRVRLSRAALETLAIVAYRQPVSTPDVEQIRGVSSAQVLRSLMEKDLVHIVGRSGSVGRALLYGTTPSFLDHLGLRHLGQLPRREELAAMWGGTDGAAAAGAVDTEQDGS